MIDMDYNAVEPQIKMPVPYLSQDIQLQVVLKNNESSHRTEANTSRSLNKKPRINMQDLTSDNVTCISSQYGKFHLSQCKNYRNEIQTNTENLSGPVLEITQNSPTRILAAERCEKTENNVNCLNITCFRKTLRSIILQKPLDRFYYYLKWPMLLLFIGTFIAFIIYFSANNLNKGAVHECQNTSDVVDPSLKPNLKNSLYLSSQNESKFLNKDVTEQILKESPTVLRPMLVSQLIKATNKISNNNVLSEEEEKRNNGYEENTEEHIYLKQGETINRIKDKNEKLNLLAFTSGHQNNFGIPIEEDERILRLLNETFVKVEHQTETLKLISPTESSEIVSPSVPLILHELLEFSTSSTVQPDEDLCQSTSLSICRGVLQYDLTSSKLERLYLDALETKVFENFFESNCSARAAEFVCSTLEPECRPTKIGTLQPCKRICKSVLEACSSIIVNSDILTYTFDCDKYPDSDDKNVCEDPTRRKDCYEQEFMCDDSSCIPNQWQCDNIKDCSKGEDEIGCLDCNAEEFRCRSNEKCLPDNYRCDKNQDCLDGSDEHDCFSDKDEENIEIFPRIFSFASFLLPNFTSENNFTPITYEDRIASGSELNESISFNGSISTIATEKTIIKLSSNSEPKLSGNLAKFQESKEIMMTSDSENKLKVLQINDTIEKPFTQSKVSLPCVGDQLRCVSGKCITVQELCDKKIDCPDGEDELMCVYSEPSQKKTLVKG